MTVAAAQAAAFYTEALAGGVVWAIEDDGGVPAPKTSDGRRAMPFWSKSSRVERIIASVPAYAGFRPLEIPLAVWRERWLPGATRDGLLVGLNWSGERATGYDVEPSEAEASLAAREGAA